MKTITKLFILVFVLLSCNSCYTYIEIQKPLEPEITNVKKPCKIVFTNHFDYTSPAYVDEKNQDSYHAGVMKLRDGILSGFSNDEYVKFFTGDTLKKSVKTGNLTSFLPVDSIHAICSRYKAEMLLSLDSLSIFLDWEIIEEEDPEGNTSRTKDYYLHTRFYISLYSSGGDLVNRSEVDKSSYYTSRMPLLSIFTPKPSVARAKKEVETLAFQAGKDFSAKFYTQEIKETRKIYIGKPFKDSNQFIKIKDWDKANMLLQQLIDSPDPKIAVKAQHNLSVVKEAKRMEAH